jgi:hypothetical protein
VTQERRPLAIAQADPACHSASGGTDTGGTITGMAPAGPVRAAGLARLPAKAAAVSAGTLGTESLLCFTHPWIGEVLTVSQVMVPLAGALAVLIVILCGSDETCERAFRLLRWVVNRPEPPAPDHTCRHQRQAPS